MSNRDPIERHAAGKFTREVDSVACYLLNDLVRSLRSGELTLDAIGNLRIEHWPTCAHAQETGPCNCQRLIRNDPTGWEAQR